MPPKNKKGKGNGHVASTTTTVTKYHPEHTTPKGRTASNRRPQSPDRGRSRTRSRSQSNGRGRSASAGGTVSVVPQGRSREALVELEDRKERTDMVKAIIGYSKAKYTTEYIHKKEKTKYSEATRTSTRQMFVATILAGAPALSEIQNLLENVKSGLTTDGALNTMLIAKHLEDLIAFTKTYAADEQHDKVATQIVNKMRHITDQLSRNNVIFEAHDMGKTEFELYLDSCTSMSKTDPKREVQRYTVGPNFNSDKLAYVSVNTKFAAIANMTIFSDICEMIRNIKPVKPTKPFEEWKKETHERRYAIDEKIQEKQDKKINARKLKSQGHQTSQRDMKREIRAERRSKYAGLLQDGETPEAENDGLPQFVKESQLSTQELLTQMKAMQLAM